MSYLNGKTKAQGGAGDCPTALGVGDRPTDQACALTSDPALFTLLGAAGLALMRMVVFGCWDSALPSMDSPWLGTEEGLSKHLVLRVGRRWRGFVGLSKSTDGGSRTICLNICKL